MASPGPAEDSPSDKFEEKLQQRAAAVRKPLEMSSPARDDQRNYYGGHFPNTPLAAATIAFMLGGVFMWGLKTFAAGGYPLSTWMTYQLGFFVASWAAFHFGEFAVTAGWNRDRCNVDSFVLDNGTQYHYANGTALLEYLVTLAFAPSWKTWPYVSIIGITMVVLGQALRSFAMIQAATNFSHTIVFKKDEKHRLVTTGVYAWFRHPSYAGFYYWALGTQLVLQNPITFVIFSYLLWRFFYYRTRIEERALVSFFGTEYEDYRRRVGTKIPFVP